MWARKVTGVFKEKLQVLLELQHLPVPRLQKASLNTFQHEMKGLGLLLVYPPGHSLLLNLFRVFPGSPRNLNTLMFSPLRESHLQKEGVRRLQVLSYFGVKPSWKRTVCFYQVSMSEELYLLKGSQLFHEKNFHS